MLPIPTSQRGFSLIELLCVIAIIGVLSTVVLAALGTARSKGIDASIRQSLAGARSQAELYYTNNGSGYYSGVCTSAGAGGTKSISSIFDAAALAANATKNTDINTGGAAGRATCHDTNAGWAAEVPQKLGGFFCVDSTLFGSTTVTTTLGPNDISCGP